MDETQRRRRSPMTDEHKAALAEGRSQGRAVRAYLQALEHNKPKPGRKRTRDSIERRLQQIAEELASADALNRLHFVQERMDLESELSHANAQVDLAVIEDEFVTSAKPYAERKGITYAAFRELGVPAAALKKAGFKVTRGQA